jgi:hypothetical protein
LESTEFDQRGGWERGEMSRSGYVDDCEGWELIRWRGWVASAIRGKRGQQFLRKLLAALDAMPEKRLIQEELEAHGDVCALGSLGRMQGLNLGELDPGDHDKLGEVFNISPKLVQEIEYVNDEYGPWNATPEQRFTAVRKWVVEQIRASAPESGGGES